MSSSARRLHHGYGEYLALEEESSTRHEYLDGEIYAMAGGTPDHAALAAAFGGVLRGVLPRGCRAFSSDLRIRILASGLSTYPDLSVVCGKTLRAPDDPHAVTNPGILVEVTSPSTEDYDRGEKLRHYKLIPSVREIVIISHRGPGVTVHRRDAEDRWVEEEAGAGQTIELPSLAARLAVDDIYRDELEDVTPPA